MILDWFKSKRAAAPVELTAYDCDGALLREIDDIVLLVDAQTDTSPNDTWLYRGVIPMGTVGTIINIYPQSGETFLSIEFKVSNRMAFTHQSAKRARLYRRREEKLKRNA